ncbi:MAG: sulfurtransferase TusA family protein [Clostridiales bacterium]|nr:sulfurtransferase TusA family protein [Clostridiales bacterium]
MITLDCLGEMCPLPIIKMQREIDKGTSDILLVTDHSCVLRSIEDYLPYTKLYYEIEEIIPGIWEIKISPKK